MAQRVIGMDLGAHAVKIAAFDVGFRSVQLSELTTIAVPGGPEPLMERCAAALQGAGSLVADGVVAVGVPGDRVLLRVLDIPFADARKIKAVVGAELADDLPWELDEIVYDAASVAVEGGSGKVQAAIAQSEEIREMLDVLSGAGIQVQQLPVAPLAYAALIRRIYGDEAVLVVDLGHVRTNVSLAHGGHSVGGRTISRGGHQITEHIAAKYQLEYADAELLKERDGLLAPDVAQIADPRIRQLATVVEEAMAPIVRDLRQSMLMVSTRVNVRPERVVICGGTAQLHGLQEYLGEVLSVPVSRLSTAHLEDLQPKSGALTPEGECVGALACALALDFGRRGELDLLQGEFSAQGDTSLFREKIWQISAAMIFILLFAGFKAYSSMQVLRKEEERLAKQVKVVTTRVFGKPIGSATQAAGRVEKAVGKSKPPIPNKTALDILDIISRRIPSEMPPEKAEGAEAEAAGAEREGGGGEAAAVPGAPAGESPEGELKQLALDVTRMDIRRGKTELRGTVNSRRAVAVIVKELKKDNCFTDVSTGSISDVGKGKKQFSMTITTDPVRCF